MPTGKLKPENAWEKWQPTADQPWDLRRASHLMRRAGFGATLSELDGYVQAGLPATLDELFSMQGRSEFDRSMQPMERVLTSSQDPRQLASWWLLRMLQTPCPLLEKTTLFWHGHFATGAEKVANARAMLRQNEWLRMHALGSFEAMLQGISKDVAMLIYLDSEENRKTRPNENYARELMELFCLGPGNFTEQDIKELSRCFTGWQIERGQFRFNRNQHDDGTKAFLGRRGNFSGEQAVAIVLEQEATAGFLVRKLVRYFVADDLSLSDALLRPLVEQLRASNFEIGSLIRRILGSQIFFSEHCIGHKVRSPVELAIGLLRSLDATTNMSELADQLLALGHLPLYPPNVKGWDGGRQWINASTFFGRVNLLRAIATQSPQYFAKDSIARAIGITRVQDPPDWIRRLLDAWVPVEVPQETWQRLLQLGEQSGQDLDQRVANVVSAIGATAEFQLS